MPSTGVKLYAGVKSSSSVPLIFGIRKAKGLLLRLGIKDNFISPPRNAYAAHLGSGVVQVAWDAPLTGSALDYEVQVANSLNGTYIPYMRSSFPQSPAFINNVPPGATAYLRIRARSNGLSLSEWLQVKRGQLVNCNVTMECTAISGSIIPAGAMFTMPYFNTDRLMGFVSSGDIIFN